ncbi:Hypothetical protein CINCED_3A008825 [Cinara cedri]|uniref:Uncharacterized protein n=1 Tax=Cinara cedri TaxID=506608 RepID=A0A5E4MHP3_9HEMI|nr:Hypothetical protein CINCED_3A008825 [Cinara cedri]
MCETNQTMKPKLRPLAVNRNCLTRSEYTEMLSTPKGYTWKGRRNLKSIMKRCKKMPQNDRLRPKNSTHTMWQHFVQQFLQNSGDSLTTAMKTILEKILNSKINFSDQEWSNYPNTQIELCKFLRNLNPDCSSSKWKQDFLKTLSSLIFNYIVQVQCSNQLSKNRKLTRLILKKINNITQAHLLPNSTDDFLQEVQIFIANMLSPWFNKPLTDSCQYANNDLQIDTSEIKQKIGESKSKLNGSLNDEMKNAKKRKTIKKSKDNENKSNNSIDRLVGLKNMGVNGKPKNVKKKNQIEKNDGKSTRNEGQKIKKKIKTLHKNDNDLLSTNVNSTNTQYKQEITAVADLSKHNSIIAEINSRAVNDTQNETILPKEEKIEEQITDQRRNTDIITTSRDTLQDNLTDKSNNETANVSNVSNVSDANKESDEGVTAKSDFSSRKSIISNHSNTPSTETNGRTEYEKGNEVISSNIEEINISYNKDQQNTSAIITSRDLLNKSSINHDKLDQEMVIETNYSNQNSKIKTPTTESKEKEVDKNSVSLLISTNDAIKLLFVWLAIDTVLSEIKTCMSRIMGYRGDHAGATKSMCTESGKSRHGYEKVCYQKFAKNISKASETRNGVCSKCNKNPGIRYHLLKREDSNYSVHKTILPISENADPTLNANPTEMTKSLSLKSKKANKCNYVYYCQNKRT